MRTIQELDSTLAAIEARVLLLENSKKNDGLSPATDAILDGQYGDPVVYKDPPRWEGKSMAGLKFSQTSPEFLDTLAAFKQWCMNKSKEKGDERGTKFARYDAEKALGWAARLRSGFVPSNGRFPTTPPEFLEDDDS